MPIRTASVKKKIAANGQALHRVAARRTEAGPSDAGPSAEEAALLEERRQLKEEREKRKAQALQPRPSALDRLVRTHHPLPKPKAAKEAHDEHAAKKPKARMSRAEKHAEKAAAIEAARKTKKTATK